MMLWLSPSLEGVPQCLSFTLLLIPPLLVMPRDHAVAVAVACNQDMGFDGWHIKTDLSGQT